MHMDAFTHNAYIEEFTEYQDFKDVFQQWQGKIHVEEGDGKADYHRQNGFPYKLENIYAPNGERL
jgi:hypothetical protein